MLKTRFYVNWTCTLLLIEEPLPKKVWNLLHTFHLNSSVWFRCWMIVCAHHKKRFVVLNWVIAHQNACSNRLTLSGQILPATSPFQFFLFIMIHYNTILYITPKFNPFPNTGLIFVLIWLREDCLKADWKCLVWSRKTLSRQLSMHAGLT